MVIKSSQAGILKILALAKLAHFNLLQGEENENIWKAQVGEYTLDC